LFLKPVEFNYKIMSKELDYTTLDNPYIRVIWEDYSENFTQEKIKSVRHYFQKKYNSTNVNVITKTKKSEETENTNVDISFNILDKNYQLELVKSYLISKGNEDLIDEIVKIDSLVDNKISLEDNEATPFKKWYIKNIEFSNFLSYGENQKIDFDKCSGINVVESNPPNFGGKTVLTVDLLLFLFFNETTKTTKAEEIFNRFTDKNKVFVKGEITIDGEEYIIVRQLERKKSKSNEWSVKTELDFFKKLSDGSLQNFTGEQRRETEEFIKTSIGSKEDFLMTILTTATNLEDLIDSKPTARGQVLSRFMGLDFLKRKEEVGKELYSEFSKSMISNVYSSEKLKSDNETFENNIIELKNSNDELNNNLKDIKERLDKGKEYRDQLLSKKNDDIDKEISLLKPEEIKEEIKGLDSKKDSTEKLLKELKVVEPSEFYHEDKHDKVKEEYNIQLKNKIEVETKIKDIEKLQESVSGGIKCEHCGIELMNAAITQNKINELAGFIVHKTQIEGLMQDLSRKDIEFVKLKKEFDEYEKNKLIKEKYELSIESFQLKVDSLNEKLKKYYEVQDKIAENAKISSLLMKANVRLDELEFEKNSTDKKINDNLSQINEKLMVSGSGYERTIASLALRAVLSKICSLPKPNLVVFDEVFGKISNENLDMVSEFFSKIKEYFEKIFLITHNPMVTNWADNVIKIKKEDNISLVIQ